MGSVILLTYEGPIRLAAFVLVLAAMGLAEWRWPRRALTGPKGVRWLNNLAIVALNSLLLRVTFPVLAVGWAVWLRSTGWGFLNVAGLPEWADFLITLIVMDAAIYGQHVAFHHVPWLWRLHRLHHTDTDIDVTTGVRFHPVEILLSMAIKIGVVSALGAHPAGVVVFELLLSLSSLFNHSNVRLPAGADRLLRLVIVTPDMHRIHHCTVRAETDSNFGFNLPWWDRLFRTYRAQPAAGHEGMTIGLDTFRHGREAWLDRMLTQPVREK